MSRIVIHAGLPKTATSFLQEKVFPFISENECLFNPEGLNRILIGLSKDVQAGCDYDSERIVLLKREVDLELERIEAPMLLLSVEGLMPLHCGGYENTETILHVLQKLFVDAEIVVFLREQLAWFRSAYSFCLVSKYVLPFDEFVCRGDDGQLGRRVHDGLGLCVFDYEYDMIRQVVEHHFPIVHFFSFEELFSERQDQVLSKLASILSVSGLKVSSSIQVNQGLDEGLMVRISNLVRCIPFRDRWRPEYLYTRCSKIGGFRKAKYLYLRKSGQFAVMLAKFLHWIFKQSGSRLFSEEETQRMREHYCQSNAAFWVSRGASLLDSGGDAGKT
jgi:hypothetical protein